MAERASDKVYAQLCRAMDAGEIAPGHRLVEVEVAAQFNVSRTPVREALIRLAREGVLEKSGRGFAVPHDDRRTLFERLDARRLLDVEMARLGATVALDADAIAALERDFSGDLAAADAAHTAGDPAAFASAHYAVRNRLRELAGNRLLARCAELVDDSFRVGRERIYRVEGFRAVTLDADRNLVDALVRRDADAAVAVTHAFLDAIERLSLSRERT